MKHLLDAPLYGRLLALPRNITYQRRTLQLISKILSYRQKSCITLVPGPNLINLFTAVVYESRVFRLGLKTLLGTNTLAYYENSSIKIVKRFKTLGPMLLIFLQLQSKNFRSKLECLSPAILHSQVNILNCNARSLPQSEAP